MENQLLNRVLFIKAKFFAKMDEFPGLSRYIKYRILFDIISVYDNQKYHDYKMYNLLDSLPEDIFDGSDSKFYIVNDDFLGFFDMLIRCAKFNSFI